MDEIKECIEYYIGMDNNIKIYCPDSKSDKNTVISWFQNNRKDLEKEYGTELVSKAKLIEKTFKTEIREDCNLNEVKFILECSHQDANGWMCYITTSSNGFPFVTSVFDDIVKGKLIFDTEFAARVWLCKHEKTLSTLYRKDVIDSITIEAITTSYIKGE